MTGNFEMFAGDSKVLQVLVLDEAGLPADITGATVRWQLAQKLAGPPLISKATGSGITVVDGPGGRFDVLLDPPDTEGLLGCYYHEAEAVNTGDITSTVLTGQADIKATLIKPAAAGVLAAPTLLRSVK